MPDDPQISIKDFAAAIKQKYPVYKKLDDDELASRMLIRYPSYSKRLNQKEWATLRAGDTYKKLQAEDDADLASQIEKQIGNVAKAQETMSATQSKIESARSAYTGTGLPFKSTGTKPTTGSKSTRTANPTYDKLLKEAQQFQQKELSRRQLGLNTDLRTVPSMKGLVSEAVETNRQDPVRQQIEEQVMKERHPTTTGGRVAKGIELLNPFDWSKDTVDPEREKEIVAAEVEKRYQQYRRSTTPEMIEARKNFGRLSPTARVLGEIPATLFGDVLQQAAGVMRLNGGLDLISTEGGPAEIANWLQERGTFFQEAANNAPLTEAGKEIERRLPEKVGRAITSAGVSIGEIVLTRKATGMSLSRILALETMLKNTDKPLRERAQEVTEAYLMGKVLDRHLSRPLSALAFGGPTALQLAPGVARGNISVGDALLDVGMQSTIGGALGGGKKAPEADVSRETVEPAKTIPGVRTGVVESTVDPKVRAAVEEAAEKAGVSQTAVSRATTRAAEPSPVAEPSLAAGGAINPVLRKEGRKWVVEIEQPSGKSTLSFKTKKAAQQGLEALQRAAQEGAKEKAPKPTEAKPAVTTPPTATAEAAPEASPGPGAAATTGTGAPSSGPGSSLHQLSEATSSLKGEPGPKLGERITTSATETVKAARNSLTSNFIDTLARFKAATQRAWKVQFSDLDKAIGSWTGSLQEITHDSRRWATKLSQAFPNPVERRGIYYYISAGGDQATLAQAAKDNAHNPAVVQALTAAMNLSPDAKLEATHIQSYFDDLLQQGINNGLLASGVDDYITRIYKVRPNSANQLMGEIHAGGGGLRTNFSYARKRVFGSVFDAMKEGYVPEDDIAKVIPIYNTSFESALAGRTLVNSLRNMTAKNGQTAFVVSGNGRREPVQGGDQEQIFVQANTKPKVKDPTTGEQYSTNEYRVIDHPSLQGIKWVGTAEDGTTVMLKGDLLVHPEFYTRLKNTLINDSPISKSKVGRVLLGQQAVIKTFAFHFSGFHQLTEAVHALAHGVNPIARIDVPGLASMVSIDFRDPTQRALIDHSLLVEETRGWAEFSEGKNWFKKVPIAGHYQDWLFKEYIPRLKMTMAMEALKRNTERYKGKLSQDQILRLTAEEANAAFGGINYRFIGRSPTTRDMMRIFLIAPDFFESRIRFAARAIPGAYGREQIRALGSMALTQYFTARIFNKLIDNDYHFEEPFGYVVGDRVYQPRTIPGDIYHFYKDPHGFFTARTSPTVRTGMELLSQRDELGRKVGVGDILLDYLKSGIPVPFRRQGDEHWWQTFLRGGGLINRPLHPLKAKKPALFSVPGTRVTSAPKKQEGYFFKRKG